MLHAWPLRIPHPAGGELALTAPIPADLARFEAHPASRRATSFALDAP